MSIIQDRQEAIKSYLGGIQEENENQLNNSSASLENSSSTGVVAEKESQPNADFKNKLLKKESLTSESFCLKNNEKKVNSRRSLINNENIDLGALKMTSSETDNIENVNKEENNEPNEAIESNSTKDLEQKVETTADLDVHEKDNDFKDDDGYEEPAKFSLDSKFNDEINTEVANNSFDIKNNGSVQNVIFLKRNIL